MIEWLLRQGANYHAVNKNGDTALQMAAKSGKQPIADLFNYYFLLN
jgi:ankyrin repeat protein